MFYAVFSLLIMRALKMLRLLVRPRVLLVQVALQQARQLLVRHGRRHRPPRRLRQVRLVVEVLRLLGVVLVVEVVKVPEVLLQGAEAADGRQGRPGLGGVGRHPVRGGDLIARDPRGRGRRQGLVDVEGPAREKEGLNLEVRAQLPQSAKQTVLMSEICTLWPALFFCCCYTQLS